MALMEWRCNYQALGRGIQPAITNSPTHLTNDITQHNVMNSIYEKNSFNIVDNIYGISLECVMVNDNNQQYYNNYLYFEILCVKNILIKILPS